MDEVFAYDTLEHLYLNHPEWAEYVVIPFGCDCGQHVIINGIKYYVFVHYGVMFYVIDEGSNRTMFKIMGMDSFIKSIEKFKFVYHNTNDDPDYCEQETLGLYEPSVFDMYCSEENEHSRDHLFRSNSNTNTAKRLSKVKFKMNEEFVHTFFYETLTINDE